MDNFSKKQGKIYLPLILLLGGIWGLLEATVGWLMHLMHLKGTFFILFPIGLWLMLKGVRQTGRPVIAFYIACIAAMIKLSNLLFNVAVPPYYVFNPAISIVLEGSVTFIILGVMQHQFRWFWQSLAVEELFMRWKLALLVFLFALVTSWATT